MKKRDVSLNTEAHRPMFNHFAEALQEIVNREGQRSSEVLRNFLEAGYRAIRGRLLVGDAFDKNEAEYMRIVKGCQHPKETMSDLGKMLGSLTAALHVEPIDFIGPVFSVLSASDEMGQFFTPHHLSYMMAKLIVGDARATLGNRRYITLAEPACGVGGMVLATNLVLREQGLDIATQAHWHLVDVDFRAMCGCYLQCALTDTSAIVVHGNTLSLEVRSTNPTPAAIMFPKSFDAEDLKPLPVAAPTGGQLALF